MSYSQIAPYDCMISHFSEKEYRNFVKNVFSWYDSNGRHDLPWRKNNDPYAILVSEIMLQQTQVSRVLPKYVVWMKRYPTLKALKKAKLSEVLVLWQGLGYQRRAKALLLISQSVEGLPDEYEVLCALPGIGDYTASALLSFAFNKPSLMLETNIRTAIIETFFLKESMVSDSSIKDVLESLLKVQQVTERGYREWYLALMDYGAYLKSQSVSHNKKVKGYRPQSPYKDSFRKVRAEVLFAILHKKELPDDERTDEVLTLLEKEQFIRRDTQGNFIVA